MLNAQEARRPVQHTPSHPLHPALITTFHLKRRFRSIFPHMKYTKSLKRALFSKPISRLKKLLDTIPKRSPPRELLANRDAPAPFETSPSRLDVHVEVEREEIVARVIEVESVLDEEIDTPVLESQSTLDIRRPNDEKRWEVALVGDEKITRSIVNEDVYGTREQTRSSDETEGIIETYVMRTYPRGLDVILSEH